MSDIHRCCIVYIAFLNHSCVTVCSIKLKDEEAEIELTGSRLEEEANMAEIEDDGSTDFYKRTFYERLLRFLTILPH